MSVESATLAGRRAAEAMMTDTGTAYRPTGHTARNADGEEVPTFTDLFTSPCKIQGPSAATADTTTRTVVVGGVERPVLSAGLHMPIAAAALVNGDEFEVTANDPFSDVQLLGRRYKIVGDPAKSHATARRFDVVQV